jgi:hypothetical protein
MNLNISNNGKSVQKPKNLISNLIKNNTIERIK